MIWKKESMWTIPTFHDTNFLPNVLFQKNSAVSPGWRWIYDSSGIRRDEWYRSWLLKNYGPQIRRKSHESCKWCDVTLPRFLHQTNISFSIIFFNWSSLPQRFDTVMTTWKSGTRSKKKWRDSFLSFRIPIRKLRPKFHLLLTSRLTQPYGCSTSFSTPPVLKIWRNEFIWRMKMFYNYFPRELLFPYFGNKSHWKARKPRFLPSDLVKTYSN